MYIFDNADAIAAERLAVLAEVIDPWTRRHLQARGIEAGWRCLEIGGGAGSIARWLADAVRPGGHVVATDLDARHVSRDGRPNLEVWQHDVLRDPLPAATFDLVHTRLVLSHLPDPGAAVRRMTHALKPGGWLVVEDFEVLDALHATHEPLLRTARAMRHLTGQQSDHGLGRRLVPLLQEAGLAGIDTEGRALIYRSGSVGARLLQLTFAQLRDRLCSSGALTPDVYDADMATMTQAGFEMRAPILWTAWGCRHAIDTSREEERPRPDGPRCQ